MKKKAFFVIGGASALILLIIIVVGIYLFSNFEEVLNPIKREDPIFGENVKIEQFESEEDFREFLQNQDSQYEYYENDFGGNMMELSIPTLDSQSTTKDFRPIEPERYSSTNTQVLTIDEADIVKTDGKDIYFSTEYTYNNYERSENSEEISYFQEQPQPNELTKIISAFPPSDMQLIGEIEEGGNLYLSNNILIIESNDGYFAYDVSTPNEPKKLWNYEYMPDTYIVTSRMYNDQLYLITSTYVHKETPCAIPLIHQDQAETISIDCTDLYYPHNYNSYETAYSAIKIDPTTGKVINTLSFLGNSYSSIVYMSENNIYFTYPKSTDEFTILYNFISENEDLFSDHYIEKVNNLNGYDISQGAKLQELSTLTEQYYRSITDDVKMEKETEVINRLETYSDEHIRDFSGTGIIKIGNTSLKILANGSVQGTPLDQFSLDEYDGYLRVATNVDPYNSGFYYFTNGLSRNFSNSFVEVNDLIVLDDDLKVVGEVRGMGVDEDIYSARFVGDAAYLVTFKQIDPFYVVDLSVPSDPLVQGELKIPGYSSYLHPLSKDLILGVGEENFRVKLSLFDVSDPTNPLELSKYSLGENWTEVEDNHKAFLHDPEHKVFFIPTYRGGYIISYENNKLEIAKTISGYDVKRAIYINDFMYIIGADRIVVLDENTWEKVSEFDID